VPVTAGVFPRAQASPGLSSNVITYPGIVFAVVARVAIPLLTHTPHFDDVRLQARNFLGDVDLGRKQRQFLL